MKSLYIIGSLALMGCAANSSSAPNKNIGTNYNIYIQSTFNASELTDVDTAIQLWRSAIPSLTLNETVSDACPVAEHTICIANSDATATVAFGYTIRDSEMDNATATILPSLQQWNHPELQTTVAHEIGHALGLVHTGEGTLMYPTGDFGATPAVLTQTDIDQFWSLR